MKAVIYLRISDEKQISNTSLTTQEEVCRGYSAKQGFEIVDVVTDEAISANKNNAQRVAELLDYCDTNYKKFDVLVVFKIDRFARSQEHHHYLRSKLLKKNIRLRSATENIGEDGSPKLIEGILAAVNEYDNDIRTERTKLGMLRRLDQGLFPWNPPLGYYLPQVSGERLSISKEDVACSGAVRELFSLYSSGLYSFSALARRLNANEVRNHRGTEVVFYKQQIVKIITNPFYVGFTTNSIDNKIRKGLHSPLISQEVFEKCKQVKEGRKYSVVRKTTNDNFPLRGLIMGECGHRFSAALSTGRWGKRYGYYFCKKRDSGNYPSTELHKKFLELLDDIQPEKEMVDLFFEIFKEQLSKNIVSGVSEQEDTTKRIKELEHKKQRLIEMRLDGDIDKDTFTSLKSGYEKELFLLENKRTEADVDIDVNIDELIAFGKSFVTNIRERWESLPVEDKIVYQGSIFPNKLVWSGNNWRTPTIQPLISSINTLKTNNVIPAGVEPAIFWMRTKCPRPLDDGTMSEPVYCT
ncbi:MAG: Site-specific recombinase, partial [Candidatus Shapirobacteria bacterium GW2011_GWE1_38_10]